MLPLILFVVPLALHFAALQFALLILLGFSLLELFAYRFVNTLFRVMHAP